MSAADPATPDRPYVNGTTAGAVIDISKHRARGAAATQARGRWTAMSTPPPAGDPQRADLTEVADFYEQWFNQIRRTLADQDTAAVFLHTLDVVDHLLRAVVAQDLITEEQRINLRDLFEAARAAPRIIAG